MICVGSRIGQIGGSPTPNGGGDANLLFAQKIVKMKKFRPGVHLLHPLNPPMMMSWQGIGITLVSFEDLTVFFLKRL